MGRLIFTLTDEERDALERVRVKMGARSFADAIRALVRREDEQNKAFAEYAAKTPRISLGRAPAEKATEKAKAAGDDVGVAVPLVGTFERKPYQKTQKKRSG